MRNWLPWLVVLALCPAPAAQSGALPAAPAPRLPRADIRARLAGVPAARLRVAPRSGALSRLRGSFALAGDDTGARVADFARRFAPLFDGGAGAEFGAAVVVSRAPSGAPAWVRVPQLVHGVPLQGRGLLVCLDEHGDALEAHGLLQPGAPAPAAPAVDADAARAAALAQLHLDADALVGAPGVRTVARVSPAGAVELVQRVALVQRAGLLPLTIDVDAQSGAVLSVRDERSSGTGHLEWDGVSLPFATGKGKGSVYTNLAGAAASKESGAALSELTTVDVSEAALALNGTLTGRYATVADLQAILFSATRSFPFTDNGSALVGGAIAEYEAFDHVNAYYWITRMAGWLGKVQGGLSSDTCLPVIVNYDDGGNGFLNAFYSPGDLDGSGGGFGAGFFVFGDFDALSGDPRDDFSRDPSIVSHEYTHCAVDKAGLTFGDDALDTPARAVNEAIADYAAASSLGDPRIGHAFMLHSGDDLGLPGDALRDLSAPLTLQDDLFDSLGQSTGLPEEHDAGTIFGAALWSARAALKPKLANALIIDGLAGWPQSSAEAGFEPVTVGNAADAYAAFYYQCFASMLDALLLAPGSGAAQQKSAGKLLGAALRHGISGAGSGVLGVDDTLYDIPATAGLSLAFDSAFLGSLTTHRFALDLTAGQTLTLSIKAAKAATTQVDFAFDDAPGDFSAGAPKKVTLGGTGVSQSKLLVNTTRTYVLTLSNPGAGGGGYSFKLKAK